MLKLGWDRETVITYFTKLLAQKRLTVMQDGIMSDVSSIEELRKNPEKYLSQIDFSILDQNPDMSVMEDNQIIDTVINKAFEDIQKLCDDENQ